MDKVISTTTNTQGVPDSDVLSSKQKEALVSLGTEVQELVEAYRNEPSPSTYKGYTVAKAKIEAAVTNKPYVEPTKHHDYGMSDVFLKLSYQAGTSFFIGVLSRFKRKALWSIPTMAVGVSNGSFYFAYHPEWYKYHTLEYCRMVLCHEAHHILQNHLPRFLNTLQSLRPLKENAPTKRETSALQAFQEFSNIAADEDVNSLLQKQRAHSLVINTGNNKDTLVLPQHYDHPTEKAYEQYLNLWLLNPASIFRNSKNAQGAQSEQGEQGEQGERCPSKEAADQYVETTGSDGHPWMKDITSGKAMGVSKEEQERIDKLREEGAEQGQIPQEAGQSKLPSNEELQQLAESLEHQRNTALISSAKQEISKHGRGTVPGKYLEEFDKLTKVCELHWTDILSNMVSEPKIAKETYKINRYNRNNILLGDMSKYGFKEEDHTYRIWVSVDTSYSMNNDAIQEGLAVIQSLLKVDSEIQVTVCEFDTTIQRITNMTADSDVMKSVEGRGGTDFNCIFTHLQDKVPEDIYPDLHVIFTDGGAPPPRKDNRIPVHKLPLLWVLTSQNSVTWFDDKYGDVIYTVTQDV